MCVIAKLDPESSEKLRSLQAISQQRGHRIKPLYGHITIAAFLSDDYQDHVRECRKMMNGLRSFTVSYRKVEVLKETSIIVASPEKAGILLQLHDMIAERFGPDLDRWTAGSDWYPHTTLVYDPEADLEQICSDIRQEFKPFEGYVNCIEFSQINETGYTIIDRIDLT